MLVYIRKPIKSTASLANVIEVAQMSMMHDKKEVFMSSEFMPALHDILTSKQGPFYVGIASITFLVAVEMLVDNKYSLSSSRGNIVASSFVSSPLELTKEATKTANEQETI